MHEVDEKCPIVGTAQPVPKLDQDEAGGDVLPAECLAETQCALMIGVARV